MRGVAQGGGGPMRRLASLSLLALALLSAAVLTAADSDDQRGKSYELVFDNAFGLTEGGDFRIAGVRAGVTDKLKLTSGYPTKAVVRAKVTEPGFATLREDAHCEIRPQSLIGEYFVDCQPGESERRLGEGDRVPVEQTESTIPLDLVANIQRRPVRERLRLILAELGAGVAGRPQDLARVLRRAHPGLRETSEALGILGRQRRTIERFIGDADQVIGALEERKQDVVRFVDEAGRTAEITASRRGDLAADFRLLPEFLAELRPNMARLGELADAQIPLLRDLQLAAGDLDTFLARVGPFSSNARPAFRALGRAADTGIDSIRATDEEVNVLRDAAADAQPTAEPLRQLLQSLDDRRRAVENDPRAKATGPPAPDKTHIPASKQGGFTGMEGLWNYYYWQALATNPFDSIGHILRVQAYLTDCSSYMNNITEANRECNRWLGPHQPGVNAPDPTEISGEQGEPSAGAAARRTASTTARGTTRAPAEPARRGRTPAPPSGRAPAKEGESELLDYLLTP
jgi:phospholipid/cholesterol/gamma-HCH transport system substrate-binding protein